MSLTRSAGTVVPVAPRKPGGRAAPSRAKAWVRGTFVRSESNVCRPPPAPSSPPNHQVSTVYHWWLGGEDGAGGGFWVDLSGFVRFGGDLLSHVLRRSTIGAVALNGRVRDGIGCFAHAVATKPDKTSWVLKPVGLSAAHPVLPTQPPSVPSRLRLGGWVGRTGWVAARSREGSRKSQTRDVFRSSS